MNWNSYWPWSGEMPLLCVSQAPYQMATLQLARISTDCGMPCQRRKQESTWNWVQFSLGGRTMEDFHWLRSEFSNVMSLEQQGKEMDVKTKNPGAALGCFPELIITW